MTYKYDVFISYSRKDYKDEATKAEIPGNPITAITEAFDKNNITYWIDLEGIYSGQEFRDKIIDAIATSNVFLFVSSHNSNQSIWTKREILEASDSGKYIIPFKIDDCEYDRSVKFELRPLDFIEYFSDKEGALQDLVRSVNMYKEEIAKEELERQSKSQKAEIKRKIESLENDFNINAARQKVALKEIMDLYARLGVKTKRCPVCDKEVPLEALLCDRCGWQFPELPNSEVEEGILSIVKANWKIINSSKAKAEINALKKEIQELKASLDESAHALSLLQEEKANLVQSTATLKEEIKTLEDQNQKAQVAYSKLTQEQVKYRNLSEKMERTTTIFHSEISEKEKHLNITKKELEKVNAQLTDLTEQLDKLNSELKIQTEKEEKYKAEIAKLRTYRIQSLNYWQAKKEKLLDPDFVTKIIRECNETIMFPWLLHKESLMSEISMDKLLSVLRNEYGTIIPKSDFNYCKTDSDIANVIIYSVKKELKELHESPYLDS